MTVDAIDCLFPDSWAVTTPAWAGKAVWPLGTPGPSERLFPGSWVVKPLSCPGGPNWLRCRLCPSELSWPRCRLCPIERLLPDCWAVMDFSCTRAAMLSSLVAGRELCWELNDTAEVLDALLAAT